MQDLVSQSISLLQHLPPAVTAAVTGSLSGILSSFVSDYLKWGFESRRDRREARRRLIEAARNVLEKPPPKEDFRETSLYFQLSPHLLATTRATMTNTILSEGGEAIEILRRGNKAVVNSYADAILKDLVVLEKKWGLI